MTKTGIVFGNEDGDVSVSGSLNGPLRCRTEFSTQFCRERKSLRLGVRFAIVPCFTCLSSPCFLFLIWSRTESILWLPLFLFFDNRYIKTKREPWLRGQHQSYLKTTLRHGTTTTLQNNGKGEIVSYSNTSHVNSLKRDLVLSSLTSSKWGRCG